MAGRKDAEVHGSFGSNDSAGPGVPTGFGARNRIRGGAGDYGKSPAAVQPGGPGGAGGANTNRKDSRALGDALAGTYDPNKIAKAGGIQLQDDLGKVRQLPPDNMAGKKSTKIFDPRIKTEREKLPSSQADPAGGPGSQKQSPKGEFGGAPGQSGSRKSNAYISGLGR